jgi:hypothetical protein
MALGEPVNPENLKLASAGHAGFLGGSSLSKSLHYQYHINGEKASRQA